MERIRLRRVIAAGISGGIAASLAVLILFRLIGFEYWGILTNPEYQSPKLIFEFFSPGICLESR